MRTLVVGDIHGGLLALQQILDRAGVTEEDRIIFLGDYVDGWSQSPDLIDFLIQLKVTHKTLFIKGNHDELLLNWLERKEKPEAWLKHGGDTSVLAYAEVSEERKRKHIAFINSTINYYLDENNRLFLHAGFTNQRGVEHEYFQKTFYWDRSLWETALSMDKTLEPNNMYYPKRFSLYNEIYIGHTPVTRIGKTIPIQMANVWNIDTGAGFKGPLTIMDVDTKEYWQSEPVNTLYPAEKGRN